MSQGPKFSLDREGRYLSNKVFYVPTTDWFLVGLLNSKVVWHYLFGICSPLRGGEWRLELRAQHVETLPIPAASPAEREAIARLAEDCQKTAEARRVAQTDFCRRIPDLAPGGATAKLSTKLAEWWRLDGFRAFQAEAKKQFRQDIPLAERNAWEDWFARQKAEVDALSARLAALEAELDRAVYALFRLDTREIALIEGERTRSCDAEGAP
ncbi:MAG: hypothetical protein EFKGCFLK_02440 [Rhodocyclaceae bacterium]|nr:MAG: hypothetical protein F9K21_04720 [Rhodocyclaceae bacterium]MBE7420971.1 hypothetical protein [Zoogloeaceae bacterium]MBV6408837.1 hypothetical protein [Rhodocyclaceae bacterium]CAG0945835.1 hypothetical protein GPROT2_03432 [Gammaproteobacteria bacterium]